LDTIESLEKALEAVETELGKSLEPLRSKAELLQMMPGISTTAAQVIVAEIGIPRQAGFPTAAHLVSWAGLCPRNGESTGTRRSTRIRPSAPWLKTTLVRAAWAAARSKNTCLRAQFLRLNGRRGPKKAILAAAASMPAATCPTLRNDVPCPDLGPLRFDRRDKTKRVNRLSRRAAGPGFQVEIRPAA
jgi:transposase